MSRILSVFACFIFIACSSEAPSSRVTSRDSAGIRIVESSTPLWNEGDPWVVEDIPVLDLATSGTGSPHEFFRIRDVIRLPDGRFVVANHGSNEIRFFSGTGEFNSAVGRQGEGPGEFQRIESLSRFRGDSIAVYDYWLSRVTILGSDGKLGRVISLRGLADRVRQLRSFGDSGFIGLSYSISPRGADPGKHRTSYAVVRVSPTGAVLDTVAILPGLETYRYAGGDVLPPFSKDGKIAVRGSELYMGSSDQMEFDRYSDAQGLETRVRVPEFDLHLEPQEVDLARRALSPEGLPPQLVEAMGTVEIPELRPAYSQLLVDSEGCVWAGEYQPRGGPEEPRDWEVFSSDGQWLGAARTPPRFAVFEIGSDYVLGVRQDEMDVEHPQLLRLRRK